MSNNELNKRILKAKKRHNLLYSPDISERNIIYISIVVIAATIDAILAYMTLDKIFTSDAMAFTWMLTISFALIVDVLVSYAPSMIRKVEYYKKDNKVRYYIMLITTTVFVLIVLLTLVAMFVLRHYVADCIFESKLDEVFQNQSDTYSFHADFNEAAERATLFFMDMINVATTLGVLCVGILRSVPMDQYNKNKIKSYNDELEEIRIDISEEEYELEISKVNNSTFDPAQKAKDNISIANEQKYVEMIKSHEDLERARTDADVSHLATEKSEELLDNKEK